MHEKGGCSKFIVHARKCFLKGLNPKQNRTIPPLKHDWVFRLKETFPEIDFVLNGGLSSIEEVSQMMSDTNSLRKSVELEGCMVGRLAIDTPW